MEKKGQKLVRIILVIVCFCTLVGCKKSGCLSCEKCREEWLYEGDVSKTKINSVADIRGYYLSHLDSAGLHTFDKDTLVAWGYQYSDYKHVFRLHRDIGREVFNPSENDSVWFIILSPDPTDIDKAEKYAVRARLKGDDIVLVRNNPGAKLLTKCIPQVKILEGQGFEMMCQCCSYTDAVVTLDVVELKISQKP